ncbi:MAG: hydrolase, partial [Oceanococcus sp.]
MENTTHHFSLRHLELADYADVKALMDNVYSALGGAWPLRKYRSQIKTFPEGQICLEDHGKVVACAFAVIVDYD